MASIRFLSGPLEGDERPLGDRSLWILGGRPVDAAPAGDEPVVELRPEGRAVLLLSRAEPVLVNGESFRRRRLVDGDVVDASGVRLAFVGDAAGELIAPPYESSEDSLADLSRHPSRADRLSLLYAIGTALGDLGNFYVGLDAVCRRLADHLGCRRAFLIEDVDGRRLPSYDFKDGDGTVAGAPPFDGALVDRVFAEGAAVLAEGPPARAATPVVAGRSVAAVLFLEAHPDRRLGRDDLDLVRAAGHQISLALSSYRLYQENCQGRLDLEAKNRQIEDLCQRLRADLDASQADLARVRAELDSRRDATRPATASPAMEAVLETIERVADTPFPVLLLGETGVGKEVLARWIHHRSRRRAGPFVAENCAAISETVLEAELFGYEKGAFTGADSQRSGLFEAASGGTLFLDEIGEMDLANQAKLLRVCQEGTVRRVGSQAAIPIDVRLVWATNRDLARMVDEGTFREDLYYRLNAIMVEIPPLRERPEDVPLLIEHLLARHGAGDRRFTPAARALLAGHGWPGNVRELENVVTRALALGRSGDLDVDVLPEVVVEGRTPGSSDLDYHGGPLVDHLEKVEREVILAAYRRHGRNKVQTAKELGIDRGTLAKRLKGYGVEE